MVFLNFYLINLILSSLSKFQRSVRCTWGASSGTVPVLSNSNEASWEQKLLHWFILWLVESTIHTFCLSPWVSENIQKITYLHILKRLLLKVFTCVVFERGDSTSILMSILISIFIVILPFERKCAKRIDRVIIILTES